MCVCLSVCVCVCVRRFWGGLRPGSVSGAELLSRELAVGGAARQVTQIKHAHEFVCLFGRKGERSGEKSLNIYTSGLLYLRGISMM